MQVFGWKKKILELRLQLERELEDQIADRADRREQWRSSSIFSSEVSSFAPIILKCSFYNLTSQALEIGREPSPF